MERVIIRYRLKKGINKKDFIVYSVNRDQPTVKKQKGVHSFEVYEVKGKENTSGEYHFFEDLLVDSFERWQEITKNEEMKKNIKEWELYGDPSSVEVIYGNKLV